MRSMDTYFSGAAATDGFRVWWVPLTARPMVAGEQAATVPRLLCPWVWAESRLSIVQCMILVAPSIKQIALN